MPELPEVETIKSGLFPLMNGKKIQLCKTFRENVRYDFHKDLEEITSGATVIDIQRRAKYILIHLDNNYSIICHMGMSGKFVIYKDEKITDDSNFSFLQKHDHLLFLINQDDKSNNMLAITYNDPRRFGFIILEKTSQLKQEKHIAKLGIEPLGDSLTPEYLKKVMTGKNQPIKTFLLDQKYIAGLGNIYVCEALWKCGISPIKPAKDVSKSKYQMLCDEIQNILHLAIKSGGSSLNDYRQVNGSMGYFQHNFQVYDQEGKVCSTVIKNKACNGIIKRIKQGGRSTFYCEKCQT